MGAAISRRLEGRLIDSPPVGRSDEARLVVLSKVMNGELLGVEDCERVVSHYRARFAGIPDQNERSVQGTRQLAARAGNDVEPEVVQWIASLVWIKIAEIRSEVGE